MKRSSVRTRLTLWSVGVLALILLGFAATVSAIVQVSISRAVDRQLQDQASRARLWWSRLSDEKMAQVRLGPDRPRGHGRDHADREESRSLQHRDHRVDHHPHRGHGLPSSPGLAALLRGDSHHHSGDPADFRPRIVNPDLSYLSPSGPHDPLWDRRAAREAGQGRVVLSTVEGWGAARLPLRVLSTPLIRHDFVEAVMQFAYPLDEVRSLVRRLTETLLALIPFALLLAGAGGAFLTNRALGPVHRVSQAAAQIGAEDLSLRLSVEGNDEFAELSSTFNGMIARLEEAFKSMEAAYEQQRRFTGDASHELRTPLTTIKANTSLALASARTVEEYREALEAADEAADVMNRIVQDLLLIARSDAGQLNLERTPTPVGEIVNRALSLTHRPDAVRPEPDVPSAPLLVLGDAHHLVRLLVNLIDNALRHTPRDGRVTVRASEREDAIVLVVEDTGEGIPPEHLPHLGERFYRVDAARARARGGAGLGLAICRSIVAAHNGAMVIHSAPGAGTRVEVSLPAAHLSRDPTAGVPNQLMNW